MEQAAGQRRGAHTGRPREFCEQPVLYLCRFSANELRQTNHKRSCRFATAPFFTSILKIRFEYGTVRFFMLFIFTALVVAGIIAVVVPILGSEMAASFTAVFAVAFAVVFAVAAVSPAVVTVVAAVIAVAAVVAAAVDAERGFFGDLDWRRVRFFRQEDNPIILYSLIRDWI